MRPCVAQSTPAAAGPVDARRRQHHVSLVAAGGKGFNQRHIGYKVQPKLGFDADLLPGELDDAPQHDGCRTVQDVMAVDPAWWEENGSQRRMTFDLAADSRSWRELQLQLGQRVRCAVPARDDGRVDRAGGHQGGVRVCGGVPRPLLQARGGEPAKLPPDIRGARVGVSRAGPRPQRCGSTCRCVSDTQSLSSDMRFEGVGRIWSRCDIV